LILLILTKNLKNNPKGVVNIDIFNNRTQESFNITPLDFTESELSDQKDRIAKAFDEVRNPEKK